MNLYKVEWIIIEDEREIDYEVENIIWSSELSDVKYECKEIFGISINAKYCLEYKDDGIYINLDKLELEKKKLFEGKSRDYRYKLSDEHITLVVIDEHTVIIIGDDEFVKCYEKERNLLKYKMLINEWVIKRLVE